MLLTFFEWLQALAEARQSVPPEVLRAYDDEMRRRLDQMAQEITDLSIRDQFQAVVDCPLKDAGGSCRSWADYVLGALIRTGAAERYDLEDALGYVFQKMILPKSDDGEERTTLFSDFDVNRPDSGEHFRARFLTWVKYAVNNIRQGKIPRLSLVDRPAGTRSIGIGRPRKGERSSDVSPEAIPARSSGDLDELVQDIEGLLQRKQGAYGLPLVDLLKATLAGMGVEEQRRRFGDVAARNGRQIIVQTIEEFAKQTGNFALSNLLQRFQEKPSSPRVTPATTPPRMEPGKDKDFASIVALIDKLGGQPVGSSLLMKHRRRWLEYPSRTPGYPNRLAEILDLMVKEGVLSASKGAAGGALYSPGPSFEKYRAA